MDNFFPTLPGWPKDNEKEHDYRLLRKLKYALVFWLVSLLLTAIWFTYSPAF